jgi:hypothetical protein
LKGFRSRASPSVNRKRWFAQGSDIVQWTSPIR